MKNKKTADEIEAWLLQEIAAHLKTTESEIDPTDLISSYGMGSLQTVTLTGDLELWLGVGNITPELFLQNLSLQGLAKKLEMGIASEVKSEFPMAATPEGAGANVDDVYLDRIFESKSSRLADRIKEASGLIQSTLYTGSYARKLLSQNDRVVQIFDYETQAPKQMVMMGSNNYLGLASHPDVKARAKRAIDEFGTGMSGPYLFNGMTSLHEELEHRLAKLKGAEAALIYPTGYQTNIGWVAGLCRDGDVLVYDELSHASFFDALMMAKSYFPGLESFAFKHNDVEHLDKILESIRSRKSANHGQIFVAVEGVYSMDGDIAPLLQIREVCDHHCALLAVDDAHGTLVLGEHGGGTGEHFGIEDKIDIVIGTFSKAFTSTGGFIAGKKDMIDYLRIFSRAHMFSAHLAPPTAGTILGCLDVVEKEPQRLKKLHENVRTLVSGLNKIGFPIKSECPILPVMIPASIDIKEFAKQIHRDGVFVNPVMYPAVPKDQQRLRMNVMATHTPGDLDLAIKVLENAARDFGMFKRAS
jgi:glycine C-acetyltransferase